MPTDPLPPLAPRLLVPTDRLTVPRPYAEGGRVIHLGIDLDPLTAQRLGNLLLAAAAEADGQADEWGIAPTAKE